MFSISSCPSIHLFIHKILSAMLCLSPPLPVLHFPFGEDVLRPDDIKLQALAFQGMQCACHNLTYFCQSHPLRSDSSRHVKHNTTELHARSKACWDGAHSSEPVTVKTSYFPPAPSLMEHVRAKVCCPGPSLGFVQMLSRPPLIGTAEQ
ncbi:hypothetical protein NQZ68_023150 [Dissostichus eleginoides]|nr:hypothetical protein NQZ68_023150 [Dissostichus eleginoides]